MLHEAQEKYKESAVQRRLSAGMTSKQLMVMLNEMHHAHVPCPNCFPWQVNFAHICKEVGYTVLEICNIWWDPVYMHMTVLGGEQLLEWAEDIINCEAKIQSATHYAALTSAKYMEIVCAAYNHAFHSKSQLKRLDTFQGMLTHGHGILHSRVTEALLGAKPDVDVLAQNLME